MRTTTNPTMWGHKSGCHRYCCGFCSCGYECTTHDDADRERFISDLLKSHACADFIRALKRVTR